MNADEIKNKLDIGDKDFMGADLRLANLSEANLSEADLRWANLSGADLRLANLSGANLRLANLSGADLSRVDLRGADLTGANLRRADLRGANLKWADLRGADLKGAVGKISIYYGGCHTAWAAGERIGIGCEIHDYQHWLDHGIEIGKSNGYTEAEIKRYMAWIIPTVEWLREEN